MKSLKKKFGKKIQSLRKSLNLTQEELALRSGISVDFLSLIERGINSPSFNTLEKLSTALEVELKELFDF